MNSISRKLKSVGIRRFSGNIALAVVCMVILTTLDFAYSQFFNANYTFNASALLKSGYWITFAVLFIATFSVGTLFWSILTATFALSLIQFANFEYFGSYVLPIHFLQLIPDFLLIMSSLAEVAGEMFPILALAGILVFLAFMVIAPLARRRMIYPRSAILVIALLAGDMAGNYLYISSNRGKLGEPAFKALYPDINNLAIHNIYKSARYLAVGILPDRLAGRTTTHPPLPAPVSIATPDANIILIINESVRAESLSILGYKLETTPRLSEVKGLYATSIYSAGTMTRTSFAGLINRLKYPGLGEQFISQSNCLFRLAKKNGFTTHFFYAQGKGREAADTLLPLMCSNYIDSVKVRSDAPEEFRVFDESLAYHLRNVDFSKPNFIVIGPNGGHSPYAEKSPAEFKSFPDEYDNAIHYTDHVVADLIQVIQDQSSKPTFVIMTSDHGEILKGEDKKRGHGWLKGKVVIVPFLFLPVNDPDKDKTMAEVAKVQSHFDIATLVMGLLGYDEKVQDGADKEIFINGSDLSGLAGQMRLHIVDSKVQSADLMNSVEEAPTLEELSLRH